MTDAVGFLRADLQPDVSSDLEARAPELANA